MDAYQLQETLFNKLDSFDIQYTEDQRLFNNLAVFDSESICIPEENFENTGTTTLVGEHVPISVSTSSSLIAMPIFLCSSNPRDLVELFIDAGEGLATQSKAQMKLKFLEVESKVSWPELWNLSMNAAAATNAFLSSRINVSKLIAKRKMLQYNFCKYRKINWLSSKNILNVTATYYQCLDLIAQNTTSTRSNPFCLPFSSMSIERNIQPTVIKKANQFVFFKFNDVQLLHNLNFLGGATSLDSFVEPSKTPETKGCFPYEKFDCPQKTNNSELPP